MSSILGHSSLTFWSILELAYPKKRKGDLLYYEASDFLTGLLVHGWNSIKTLHCYSLLDLSTYKYVKLLPNYDKVSEPLHLGHRKVEASRLLS